MSHTPVDAIRLRNTVVQDWDHNPHVPRFLRSYLGSQNRPPGRITDPDKLREWLAMHARVAEVFFINDEMQILATAAAESLSDDDAPIEAHHVPSYDGILMFDTPVTFRDIRGAPLRFAAVQWVVVGGSVFLMWMTDKYDPLDPVNATMRADASEREYSEMHRYQLSITTQITFGEPLRELLHGVGGVLPPEADVHMRDGAVTVTGMPELPEGFDVLPRRDPMSLLMTVIWRLMQQSITSVDDYAGTIPKAVRRESAKKKGPAAVTVIQLRHRRLRVEDGEERHVEWSHRWLVRGHWRRQPYKNPDGSTRHEMIFIAPFIKGPDGKPLVITEKVNSLVR